MSSLRLRRFTPSGRAPLRERDPERGVVVLIRVLLAFEAAMYSAVAPVLPHYAHALHAGKPAVGLLAASYPAGMLPGSLLGGWLATRRGIRFTTVVGLLTFAVSIAAFGFGTDITMLDSLRFVQGIACGCIWGGGLTWVIAIAPSHRRGEILGSVIGAAIFGTLLGPVLGILAVTFSTQIVFALVGATSLALAAWTLEHSEPPQAESETSTPLRALASSPRILLGFWLILLEACTLGATGTLLPLRLSRFGAPSVAIGATFLLASLVSTFIAKPIGKVVDRRGAGLPLCIGLTMTAMLLATLALPQSWALLALMSIILLGGPLTAYTIPAMSVITDVAERLGIALALATMMLNLAWAAGETAGAPIAANLSQATSDTVPFLLLAGIMVLTLFPVLRARLRAPAPQPEADEDAGPSRPERIPVASVTAR